MIKKNSYLSRTILALLVLVFLSTSSVSAADCQVPVYTPIAEVIIEPGGIIWVPRVSYARLEVTISRPDGTIYSEGFKSGSTPQVGLSKVLGEGYCDGSYIYELRVIPSLEWMTRDGDEVEVRYSERALVQNGGFSVYQGEIVVPEETEPERKKSASISSAKSISSTQDGISRTLDFVINDDLIVDGSACIGFDCVNGESFGFDTLRLKENNLRIKFDDTSVAAQYPRNDWQLTANDSANGGASKFSIDDISGNRTPFTVEANARSHSLYVDDGLEIHVIDGDTPGLRLQQDGSSGFAPQTWDVAANETNFFIRDVTNGSQLPFRIRPDAPTNSIFIDVDGDIGLGTSSPDASLHIEQVSDTDGIYLNSNSSTDAVIKIEKDTYSIGKMTAGNAAVQVGSFSDHKVHFVTGATTTKRITIDDTNGYVGIGDTTPSYPIEVGIANGAYLTTTGNWTSTSSRELKENIRNLTADKALEALKGLTPVQYNYKVDKEEGYVGFIAEDVPELVALKERKGLIALEMTAILTKVVQEQQKSLQQQQKVIAELQKKVSELEKKK
jgi:hypothetical protein